MQKITPFLWFNDNAEAAVKFYASVFKKVKVTRVARYSKSASTASGRPKDSVMTIAFKMFGQEFVALNGGPHFKFNEAVSFVVNCRTQKEIDYYWKKLSAGGHEGQCGWLKDKFGVSWQVVPEQTEKWISGQDPDRTERVMQVVLRMKKLDLKAMQKAYAQK